MVNNVKSVQFIELTGDLDKIKYNEDIINKIVRIMHIHDETTNEYYLAVTIIDNFPEDVNAKIVDNVDTLELLNDVVIQNSDSF